jgi:hypothetical protein
LPCISGLPAWPMLNSIGKELKANDGLHKGVGRLSTSDEDQSLEDPWMGFLEGPFEFGAAYDPAVLEEVIASPTMTARQLQMKAVPDFKKVCALSFRDQTCFFNVFCKAELCVHVFDIPIPLYFYSYFVWKVFPQVEDYETLESETTFFGNRLLAHHMARFTKPNEIGPQRPQHISLVHWRFGGAGGAHRPSSHRRMLFRRQYACSKCEFV